MMTSGNFWDSEIWSFIVLIAVLLGSMLVANIIKQYIKPLKKSLIPSSVLGGLILLIISSCCKIFGGEYLFNLPIFDSNGNGIGQLETITYHCLGLGFIAMAMRKSGSKISKKRSGEVFDTGVTTVSTYLIQAIVGLGITIVIGLLFLPTFFKGAGLLLPFGYGQGTGQAMNYGKIYETEAGFTGGTSFGLTIAALGFLSASIFGVIYLNILRRKGVIKTLDNENRAESLSLANIQESNEIPMNESFDKMTVQIGIIVIIYAASYAVMMLIGKLTGMYSVLFGFNFLVGTLLAVLVKKILTILKKKSIMKREYVNSFLMNRLGGFFFDLMIVAGMAAIQIDLIKDYLVILLVLGAAGAFVTFFYVNFVCKKLFPSYRHEQFLAMFGMLTGTASTGIILLREIDPDFNTPASENLVYQTLPAIVFGFPMMLLATYVYKSAAAVYITFGIVIVFFVVMNLILFRRLIFKRKTPVQTNEKTE